MMAVMQQLLPWPCRQLCWAAWMQLQEPCLHLCWAWTQRQLLLHTILQQRLQSQPLPPCVHHTGCRNGVRQHHTWQQQQTSPCSSVSHTQADLTANAHSASVLGER